MFGYNREESLLEDLDEDMGMGGSSLGSDFRDEFKQAINRMKDEGLFSDETTRKDIIRYIEENLIK